jgi:hypothetical protein
MDGDNSLCSDVERVAHAPTRLGFWDHLRGPAQRVLSPQRAAALFSAKIEVARYYLPDHLGTLDATMAA